MLAIAFFAGLYGYLFPGNINTMMMHLREQRRNRLLLGVIILAVSFEFAYCYAAISFLGFIGSDRVVANVLSSVGCVLSLGFGAWILLERTSALKERDNSILARGIISIVIHPQQIPFWLFVYAIARPFGNIASPALFALADVLGCLVVYFAYVYGGHRLLSALKINHAHIQTIIGLLYLMSAITSAVKLVF